MKNGNGGGFATRLKHPEAPRLLARNVWRFREQRRITASALAEKLDWPLVKIDKIENGDESDLSLDDLERLALALFVEPSVSIGPEH